MTYSVDNNQRSVIINVKYDSVIPNSDSVSSFLTTQLANPVWSRILLQFVDGRTHAKLNAEWKRAKITFG